MSDTPTSCWFDFEDGHTCVLPDGHACDHEPTPDDEMFVSWLAPEVTD